VVTAATDYVITSKSIVANSSSQSDVVGSNTTIYSLITIVHNICKGVSVSMHVSNPLLHIISMVEHFLNFVGSVLG